MKKAPRPRPGGRSARVVRDVLEATLEELAAHGYSPLTVEAVAARAGVAKTTIYRRWPTKAELVAAAVLERKDDQREVPDEGSLRADLFVLLEQRARRLSTRRGRAIARALLGGIDEPEVAAFVAEVRARRPFVPKVVLARAIARLEVPKSIDGALFVELLGAPLETRLVWRGLRVDAAYLRRLIDVVITGFTGSPKKLKASGAAR